MGQGGVTHRITCTWWLLGKRLEAKIEVISYFRLDALEEFISQALQVFCSLHDFSSSIPNLFDITLRVMTPIVFLLLTAAGKRSGVSVLHLLVYI